MADGDTELTAEDLKEMVRMLDLIPIPERVLPQVLDAVREQRARCGALPSRGWRWTRR